MPGLSLHYEMQMFADMGISPMKAIQAATLWAAESFGQAKNVGSIEAGKLADFLIIEGNPLADISTTASRRNQSYLLNGRKAVVLHGDSAHVFVVCARTSGAQRDEGGGQVYQGVPPQDESRAGDGPRSGSSHAAR